MARNALAKERLPSPRWLNTGCFLREGCRDSLASGNLTGRGSQRKHTEKGDHAHVVVRRKEGRKVRTAANHQSK